MAEDNDPVHVVGELVWIAALQTNDGQDWYSLHVNHDDAQAKLLAVADAWNLGDFYKSSENRIQGWSIQPRTVLSSKQSSQPPSVGEHGQPLPSGDSK